MTICRVCRATTVTAFGTFGRRRYWRCNTCQATLLDPKHFLNAEEEHAQYKQHDNRVDDARYRAFLERLAGPLRSRLPAKVHGLDYGSGPGPALAAMLEESGFAMTIYDPFFAPDADALSRQYDFVTCTETAEHFHNPAAEFDRLMGMINAGGWLAIMTSFQTEDERFEGWHYRLDPTHVVFYREATFRLLAARAGWLCEVPSKDVVLMQRTV